MSGPTAENRWHHGRPETVGPGTHPGTWPEGPGSPGAPERWQNGWQIGGLGGSRGRGSELLLSPLLQPVCGGGGSQLCIYRPTHTHIWKMFPSTGLLEGFWEVTPGGGWDRGLRAPHPAKPTQRPAPLSSVHISFPWPVFYRLLKEDGPTSRTYGCKLGDTGSRAFSNSWVLDQLQTSQRQQRGQPSPEPVHNHSSRASASSPGRQVDSLPVSHQGSPHTIHDLSQKAEMENLDTGAGAH